MNISITSYKFDPESTERKDLYIEDVFVGTYSFGLFSKWAQKRVDNDLDFDLLDIQIRQLIKNEYGIVIKSKEDLTKVINLVAPKTIGEWFEERMLEYVNS